MGQKLHQERCRHSAGLSLYAGAFHGVQGAQSQATAKGGIDFAAIQRQSSVPGRRRDSRDPGAQLRQKGSRHKESS
jgi:hypothetical protein